MNADHAGPFAPGATRTRNLRIRSPLLYPLSYGGSHIIIVVLKATLKFGRKHFMCDAAVACRSDYE